MLHLLPYYYFLSVGFVFAFEGKYEKHEQFCDGTKSVDTEWSLDIKENHTYLFQITKTKSEFLSRPKVTLLSGKWESTGDTLKLYDWYGKDNPILFCTKNNKLFLQSKGLKPGYTAIAGVAYLEKL